MLIKKLIYAEVQVAPAKIYILTSPGEIINAVVLVLMSFNAVISNFSYVKRWFENQPK